jgi:dienelactone hydrolase
MIARFFHAWERRLFDRTDDRVVRPFEWGLEWTGANGHASLAAPDAALAEWAREALADSPRFFDAPPTDDYAWEPESGGDRTCAGTVMFPSVITTPHPENNTVYGRLFPARRKKGGGEDRRRAVVVLPQWNGDADAHVSLSRLLAAVGINALRLSMPYHDRRMPPILHRADFIVSANVGRTLEVCRQAVVDARRAVGWLAREGYERIGILGTSLGSCLAMLTAAHEPLIKAEALNHISRYFADVVWEGLSTEHVRESLDGKVTLDRLRELWMPISPQAYVARVRETRTLLVYARYDTTFPVHLSRDLIDEFDRLGVPYQLAVLPCGHYTTGLAPFKYLDGYLLTKFLVKNL